MTAASSRPGTPEDIYERPETEFVARFIGGTNILTRHARRDRHRCLRGRARAAMRQRQLAAARQGQRSRSAITTSNCHRPSQAVPTRMSTAGTVTRQIYLGSHRDYLVSNRWRRNGAHCRAGQRRDPGRPGSLAAFPAGALPGARTIREEATACGRKLYPPQLLASATGGRQLRRLGRSAGALSGDAGTRWPRPRPKARWSSTRRPTSTVAEKLAELFKSEISRHRTYRSSAPARSASSSASARNTRPASTMPT